MKILKWYNSEILYESEKETVRDAVNVTSHLLPQFLVRLAGEQMGHTPTT